MATEFQIHHIISKNILANDLLIQTLNRFGLFQLNGSDNLLILPASRDITQLLVEDIGAISISPHNGRPLASYEENGIDLYLQKLVANNPVEWGLAQRGGFTSPSIF